MEWDKLFFMNRNAIFPSVTQSYLDPHHIGEFMVTLDTVKSCDLTPGAILTTTHTPSDSSCSDALGWFQMVLLRRPALSGAGVNAVKLDGHGSGGHSCWTASHLHVTIMASNFLLSHSARRDRMIGGS